MRSTAAAAPSTSWLFGPSVDLLLGCGGLYVLFFLAFAVSGPELRLSQPPALAPWLVLVFGMPHYAATLLRVYERRSERRRYAVFAVHLTLLMAGLFVAALHAPLLGVALVTLYITWSPWHYSGQNFGLAMMFLGRRGVAVDHASRRALHASFVLSWILAIVVMHAGQGDVDNAVSYVSTYAGGGMPVRFQPLGIPASVVGIAVPALGTLYLASLAVAVARLRRRGSWSDLAPAGLLVLTQALWFSIPFVFRHAGQSLGIDVLDPRHRTHYFLWIAVGHSVQYLWVSTYYARRAPGWRGAPWYLGKTLVAGTALWTLPLLAFAPGALGSLSYEAGLFLVLSAAINLHHFILDGAIWKLRDRKVGGALLRGANDVEGPGEERGLLRRGVWAVAGAGFVLALVFHGAQTTHGARFAAGDYTAAARSLDVLHWFGTDGPRLRSRVARGLAQDGDVEGALAQLDRGLAMGTNLEAMVLRARLLGRQGAWEQAAVQWDEALGHTERPRADLLRFSAQAWRRAGDPDQAERRLRRVRELREGRSDRSREPTASFRAR